MDLYHLIYRVLICKNKYKKFILIMVTRRVTIIGSRRELIGYIDTYSYFEL